MGYNENTINCEGCIYLTSNNVLKRANIKKHICTLGKFKIKCKEKVTHESNKTSKIVIRRSIKNE